MVRLQYMWPSPTTWMLVINTLLSILSIGLPVARKDDKITVHVTLSHDNEELMTNIHVVGEGHMYCNLTMFSCHWKTNSQNTPQHGCWSSTLHYLFCLLVFQWQENMIRLQYMWPSPTTWMLVINSLLSILSIDLPVARRHGKITVHVTLPHNMDVGQIDNRELMTNIHVVGGGHMYCNLNLFFWQWKNNRQNR
jgi:hypothetical protein